MDSLISLDFPLHWIYMQGYQCLLFFKLLVLTALYIGFRNYINIGELDPAKISQGQVLLEPLREVNHN